MLIAGNQDKRRSRPTNSDPKEKRLFHKYLTTESNTN